MLPLLDTIDDVAGYKRDESSKLPENVHISSRLLFQNHESRNRKNPNDPKPCDLEINPKLYN